MFTRKLPWLFVAFTLLAISALHGASITENGMDQPITFTFPPGFGAFPVDFRSDVSPDNETTNELADILTVTFPGEAQKTATSPTPEVGQTNLFQRGYLTGTKIDQVTVDDPGIFGGTSDFVALYFDATRGKFAVGFTSCSACSLPADQFSVPEPTTCLLFGAGVIGLLGYRRGKKVIRV